MSSIADILKEQTTTDRCRFSKLMDSLDADDSIAVYACMKSGLTPNKIAKAIRSGGHKISHSTIAEHKEKQCMCKGEFQWVA